MAGPGEGIGAVAATSRKAAELLTRTAPGAVRGFAFRVTARNLSQVA